MGAISAVLLAAGRGTRLAGPIPKAYLPLGGKPIIAYSLEVFSACALVSDLIIVIHPDDRELFANAVRNLAKPLTVVHGGAHRQESALAGVKAAQSEYVLVHDAARPFVSKELIERVIEAMKTHDAAVPVLPVTSSVKRVSEGFITADVDRSEIFFSQTPQGFRRELLLAALERACREHRYFSDEAGAVLALNTIRIKTIEGDPRNIKITTAADLKLAECFALELR